MRCDEARGIMDGYVDRELDLVTSLEMERHLDGCRACAGVYAGRRALQASLRAGSLSHRAPAGLEARVRAAVREAPGPPMVPERARSRVARTFHTRDGGRLAGAAAVVMAGLLGWGMGHVAPGPAPADLLAREVFASDMRALMAADGGVEVQSSDRHTVKPWFAGKLDFSPPVQDLAARGYPLVGGRRDYVDGRPVAALVYARHAHRINLYVWPSQDPGTAEETRQGYHLVHWARAGMAYWAVSDLDAGELRAFVRLIRSEA